MNIPGPVKTSPEILEVFQACTIKIFEVLQNLDLNCLAQTEYHEITGDELILCIDCDDAKLIKDAMVAIEETHPFGRLFDIDVIDNNGHKLTRNTFRKCFICDWQAQDCASSRRHSVVEMQSAIEAALKQGFFTF